MLRQTHAPRIAFFGPVELYFEQDPPDVIGALPQGVISGSAINLSVGGLYVCGPMLPPETRLRVTLRLGESLLHSEALVVRVGQQAHEPPGLALRFVGLAAEETLLIERFVGARLATPASCDVACEHHDDPVCTADYTAHIRALDLSLRAIRRRRVRVHSR